MSDPPHGGQQLDNGFAMLPQGEQVFQPQSSFEFDGRSNEEYRYSQQNMVSVNDYDGESFCMPQGQGMNNEAVFDNAGDPFAMEGNPFDQQMYDLDVSPDMYYPPDMAAPQQLLWQEGLTSPEEDILDPAFQHSLSSSPVKIKVENDQHNGSDQFGQITPPDDASREGLPSSRSKRMLPPASQATALNKSERARNAANQRHAKTKKARRDSRVKGESDEEQDSESDDKQNRYREKNRVAAAKCRQKKKETMETLEDRHRNLSAHNNFLRRVEQDLREELTTWKTKALDHAECGCGNIQRYNSDQAHHLVFGHPSGSSASRRRQSLVESTVEHAARHARHQSYHAVPSSVNFASESNQGTAYDPTSEQMDVFFEESPQDG